MKDRTKTIIKAAVAALFFGLIFFVYKTWFSEYNDMNKLFSLIETNRTGLEAFVTKYYIGAVLLFVLAYTISTGLSLPIGTALTLSGGFVFGTLPGAFYVNIGATAGAVLAFLAARYLFGNGLQKKYQEQLEKFNREMDENGSFYLLFLRLVPLFPFVLVNILPGLTRVKLRHYIWTTSLGIIPGSIAYTFIGSRLGAIQDISDIKRNLLMVLGVLITISLLPVLLKKTIFKKKNTQAV